ncbi:MAG: transporter substrate-binding domain-containing protein [Bacilli bacterium]|nr:transporter substrate-binding domain-containing protein [Bacilli bacterium]
MKKLLSLLFMVVCLITFTSCGGSEVDNRPTFTVGMECGYAPFNWTESVKTDTNYPIDGTSLYAEGYDVQIAKKIAENMGCRLVVKAIEWDGLINALEAGQIDAIIAGMSDTEERRLSVDFTAPYYRSTHVLVMNKDSKYVNGKTLDDFAGANVQGQLETLYDSLIDQLTGVNHMTPLSSVPEIITSIKSGRTDITILEEPVAKGLIETNPDLTYIKLEKGFNVSEEDVCVAIAIAKGNSDLNDKVSQVLASITEAERNQLMNEAIAKNAE